MTIPNKQKNNVLIKWLILCYVLTLPITNFEFLPWVENKIQIPEIIFVILFSTIILHGKWYLFKVRNKTFVFAVGLYLGVGALSFFVNQEKEIIVELAKVGYLFIACLIISNFLIENTRKEYQDLIKYMIYGGVLFSLGGILTWSYSTILNQPSFLVDFYEGYPIIGDTYRAKFLTYTPTMFAIFISVCIFFLFDKILKNKKDRFQNFLFLFILFFCLVLTFSKTILILIPILCLLFFYYYKPSKWYLKTGSVVFFASCFVLFNFLSHFSFLDKKDKINTSNGKYLSNEIVLELEERVILKNSYLILKENTISAFKHSPIVGIGLGRFDNYLEKLKEEDTYPKYLRSYDPHSTYFGVLAELGIGGVFALLLIMRSVFKMVGKRKEFIPYLGVLSLFLCEGIVTDMMNVRHLWLIFSLLIYLHFRKKDIAPVHQQFLMWKNSRSYKEE